MKFANFSDKTQQQSVPAQAPSNASPAPTQGTFSPGILKSRVDAAIHRLKKGDKVRVLHPELNSVHDVTITCGHGKKRPSEKSWYTFYGPQGRQTYDFNDLVWEKLNPVVSNFTNEIKK